jgi:hypothetical protein
MPPLFDPVRRLFFIPARRNLRDVGIDEAGDHHAGDRAPSGAFATFENNPPYSAARAIGPTTG